MDMNEIIQAGVINKMNKRSKMSDARASIVSSIIDGLSKNAHITHASIEYADIQSEDIIEAIFHPSVRWAVAMYLKEIDKSK